MDTELSLMDSDDDYSPPFLKEIPKGVKVPVKISDDEIKKLTITIMGFEFISFGSALICPVCGKQAGIIIDRAPDDTFAFYLRFPCRDYDPKPDTSPTPEPTTTPAE